MKMLAIPWAFRSWTNFSILCDSLTERLFVGSSRIMSFVLKYMARAMATPCLCPPESCSTIACGERSSSPTPSRAFTDSFAMAPTRSQRSGPTGGRLPSHEDVAHDGDLVDQRRLLVDGLDPQLHGVPGDARRTSLPSQKIFPASGG